VVEFNNLLNEIVSDCLKVNYRRIEQKLFLRQNPEKNVAITMKPVSLLFVGFGDTKNGDQKQKVNADVATFLETGA
jgi:hypothetical protein